MIRNPKTLVGRRIVDAYTAPADAPEGMPLDAQTILLLDDGTALAAFADSEQNGAGALFSVHCTSGEHSLVLDREAEVT